MMRVALLLVALALPAGALAQPLTIKLGESWAFAVKDGQPVRAHRVKPTAKPARGEIKASVAGLGGTTMTLINNSAISYTYRAQLLGLPSKAATRTCTLPAKMQPSLEYWPLKATAIRLSDFRPAKGAGSCPKPGG